MSDINPGVDDPRTAMPTQPPTAATSPKESDAGASGASGSSTKDVAADEAKSVAADARASGRQVAETAKQQAGDVVDEVRTQARDVYAQAKQELAGHAGEQHRRAGAGLHALAEELHDMVNGSPDGGLATDLAHQAAGRVSALAGWFDGHEPGDALEELRSIARRRPGAFLAGAAVLGLVAGRLTRGTVDDARDGATDSPDGSAYRADPASVAGRADRTGSAPLASSITGENSGYATGGLAAGGVGVRQTDADTLASSRQVDPS